MCRTIIRPISFSPLAPAFLSAVPSRDNRAILNKPKIEIRFREETQYMRKIWISFLMMLPCLVTQGGERCQEVGGAILTNALHETGNIIFSSNGNPGSNSVSFVDIALGAATGDLRGGVVVYILSFKPIVAHGNWVTESGDTLYTDQASATAVGPIPGSNVSAAIYPAGLKITGGTGRFAGASGYINILFGAGDSVAGQFIYRYQGTICFAQPQD
jgi:hypothetical protein